MRNSFCSNDPSSAETQRHQKHALAVNCAIVDAIEKAKRILEKIDERWPAFERRTMERQEWNI